MASENSDVAGTKLTLEWGAKNIANALNLPGPNPERKVYHLHRTGAVPGLKSVGNRLVLDLSVAKRAFEEDLGA